MTAHVLQCVWPIQDDTYTRSQLIAEALEQLDLLAERANAVVTGPPMWVITDAETTPGWHAYAPGSLLIAVMPAEPYGTVRDWAARGIETDPMAVERIISGDPPERVRDADKRAAAIAMTNAGRKAGEVALQLGLQRRSVHQARTRHNRRQQAIAVA